MNNKPFQSFACSAALAGMLLVNPAAAAAQDPREDGTAPARVAPGGLGVDLFGGAGFSWPVAKDSFNAVDLSSRALEVGGGARVTGLPRQFFGQIAVAHWSDTGERAFVADDGTSFPLGIPLEVDATFFDGTIGIKNAVRSSTGRTSALYYVGAGAGVVRYQERSAFAGPGDDLEATEPSYHVLLGVEVPISGLLAFAIDAKYRHVPGVLGDGGTSGVLAEDSLGGFHASVGLRLGFGGRPTVAAAPRSAPPGMEPPDGRSADVAPASELDGLPRGVLSAAAPAFIAPDANRTPLRTLAPGTEVRILEQTPDWLRIEWNDSQFGRRVGYIERKFVTIRRTP